MSEIASEVATTGSDEAQQGASLPVTYKDRPDRLEALGYNRRRNVAPLKALTPKQRLLIEYMTVGCPHQAVAQRVGKNANEPLSLIEAADLLRFRRRNARRLWEEKLFQVEHNKALQALKDGHKAEAVRTIIEVMRDEGQGKAADRKVRLQAADMIAGISEGKAGVSVTVNNNTQTNVQLNAGIVIRLPATAPAAPLESQTVEQSVSDESEQ